MANRTRNGAAAGAKKRAAFEKELRERLEKRGSTEPEAKPGGKKVVTKTEGSAAEPAEQTTD